MKKILSLLTLFALLLVFAVPALAASVQRSSQALQVDGKNVDCEAYNIDGSNYFKLRDLAQLLNGTGSQFAVGYDEASRTVTITTGKSYTSVGGELAVGADQSASAQPSSQTILIDGKKNGSLGAYLIGGNNYFKLRDLGAALGFSVGYDTASRTMLVKSREAQTSTATRLGQTADAGREYLDKIVFLGDSTTYGIGYYYNRGYSELCPPSQIWTPSSGTLTLSYYDTAKIVYPATGTEMGIFEAAAAAKPEILLITLGVNGISFMDKDWFIRDYTALVQGIQQASPDTRIILNSIYPVADSYQYLSSINNERINAANEWIESIAVATGTRYLNSREVLAENGKLPESSQNGDGLHLTGEAFTKVMQYIRTHALP